MNMRVTNGAGTIERVRRELKETSSAVAEAAGWDSSMSAAC